MFFYILV